MTSVEFDLLVAPQLVGGQTVAHKPPVGNEKRLVRHFCFAGAKPNAVLPPLFKSLLKAGWNGTNNSALKATFTMKNKVARYWMSIQVHEITNSPCSPLVEVMASRRTNK